MTVLRGRHALHSPGPTNIPDRILNAMHRPAIDFMGPLFTDVREECFEGLKAVFKTERAPAVYVSSGHGGWEAALVNTCSPGDRVVIPEHGVFSRGWKEMAEALGLVVDDMPGDWRRGVDAAALEARLVEDRGLAVKAVAVVHTDTSTGVTTDLAAVRRAIDNAGHPALLLVDAVASLVTTDFRMDDWSIDVAVVGSQKGLMLPTGLGLTCVSEKARRAAETAGFPRSYWDWRKRLPEGLAPQFSGTAPVHLFYGLQEALRMIFEEGLEAIFERHRRFAGAVRAAVGAWGCDGGIEVFALDPAEHANAVTTILTPEGHDAEALRAICVERHNLALGTGLRHLKGKAFRIGHLGDLNATMVLGALAATELGLAEANMPHAGGGVTAAIEYLATQ